MESHENRLPHSLPAALAWLHSHIPDLVDVTQKPLPGKNTHRAEVLTGDIRSGASRSKDRRKEVVLVGRRKAPLTINTASLSFCYVPDPV